MNKGKWLAKYSLHGASGYTWEHPKIRTQETYMVLLNDSKNPVGENFAPLGGSEFFTWIILGTIFCLVGGRMVACCRPAIQKAPMCGIINLPRFTINFQPTCWNIFHIRRVSGHIIWDAFPISGFGFTCQFIANHLFTNGMLKQSLYGKWMNMVCFTKTSPSGHN